MKHTSIAAAFAAVITSACLSACGGGGSDDSGTITASTPAKFASTDQVAVLIGGFASTFDTFDTSDSKSTMDRKRASLSKSQGGFASKSAQIKATSTTNCDSGSISFTDDTSTTYQYDGLTVASSCKYSSSSGGSSFSSQINGKTADKCTDSAQTAEACKAETVRIADGANGNTTLDLAFVGNDNGSREDFEIKMKGDLSSSSTSTTESSQISGTLSYNDKIEKISGTALFDNLQSVFTANSSSGGGTETINGAFGFSASTKNCSTSFYR